MIKIKLYYSIVTILFLISCVSNKGNDFLSIPAKPIYGSYYDKEIMSNELVAFSSLDCGILMVQRCKLPGEPICQILEEQTGERVGSFGSRGQGPGEFIAAEFIGKTEGDDTLYFVNLPSTVLLYAREEKGADYRYVGSEKIKVKMVVLQPVSVDCPMVIVWRRLCLGVRSFSFSLIGILKK